MSTTCTVTPGATMNTGVELTAPLLNLLGTPSVTVPSISATSITLENYTVTTMPGHAVGRLVYVSNGDAGSPCLAVSNGSSWLRINLGSAVSATATEEYITAE